jgi:hypothetical protein
MGKIACCHNCAFSYWDREHTVRCMTLGVMNWPACANHPESYGRMQRVPERGMCSNYRARPGTPEGDVRQISLGEGFYAYVDAADYEWLSRWIWHLCNGYAARMGKGKFTYMHREIMQPPKGMTVDHRNHNKLDNTRANLHSCTHADNACNRRKRRGTSSRFRGVIYRKDRDNYCAEVYYRSERFFLGYFRNEIEAARVHDRKAVELMGESAQVNFPEEWPAERRAQVYAQRDAGARGERRVRETVRDKGRQTRARGRGLTSRVRRTGTKSQS